jgi:hypothetical protein
MKKIIIHKHLFIILMLLLNLTNSCTFAQKKEDITPKPKVHINVNKETDEHGNIIRYDSTYVWSWSNLDTNVNYLNSDSIFASFFNRHKRFSFFDDSLFFKPFSFFDDNFFNFDKDFENMMKRHREIMRQQEEMFKRFFEPQPLIPAPQEPKQNSDTKKEKNPSAISNKKGIDL